MVGSAAGLRGRTFGKPAFGLAAGALLASLAISGERIHLVTQALDAIERGFESLLRIISLLRDLADGAE